MSCYEWERGTIKLPTAAVVTVKKAVRHAAVAHRDEVERICKLWWRDNKTSSNTKYDERLRNLNIRNYARDDEALYEPVLFTLEAVFDRHWQEAGRPPKGPRQIQQRDLDETLGPKPTSRTTSFNCDEATITFNGSTVTWNVPENNHACDTAHNHPVARAFFAALSRVTWTRGSGGQIIGNNEYNRDSDHAGGGGNYVTAIFGPKVAKSLASNGRRW